MSNALNLSLNYQFSHCIPLQIRLPARLDKLTIFSYRIRYFGENDYVSADIENEFFSFQHIFTNFLKIFKAFDNFSMLQKMLIICMERDNESLVSFYGRTLKFLRAILARGAELIATRDMIIRKRELPSSFVFKKYAKSSGQ